MNGKHLSFAIALCATVLNSACPLAHESPVDHVDRAIRIWVQNGKLRVRYQLQLSERSATAQLTQMDADRDGMIGDNERTAYFDKAQKELAAQLSVKLDGKELAVEPDGVVQLLPQFKQVYEFSVAAGALEKGRHVGEFTDRFSRNYPGAYRWDEPKAPVAGEGRVIVSEAPKTHASDGHPSILLIKFEVVMQ